MENIQLTQTELDNIYKEKTLKHLIFCYYKYRSNEEPRFKQLLNYNEVDTYAGSDYNFIYCRSFFRAKYKAIAYEIAEIQKNFNVKPLKMLIKKPETARFLYELIIRVNERSNIWRPIIQLHNFNREGFLNAYRNLSTVEEKKDFLEEIDFFIKSKYESILSEKGAAIANDYKTNMLDITHRRLLDLWFFFDSYDIQLPLKDIKIFTTEDAIQNPECVVKAEIYRNYLQEIRDGITSTINKINKIFGEQHPTLFQYQIQSSAPQKNHVTSSSQIDPVDLLEENMDLLGLDPMACASQLKMEELDIQLIETIVSMLKKLDEKFYKKLTVDNYESFINSDNVSKSDSERQIRFDKIQRDLSNILPMLDYDDKTRIVLEDVLSYFPK